MHTICDNFSFFFTPISILVIHLFVGQLSGWFSPWLVLPFQNVQAGELTHPCRLAHQKPFQEMMWWCYLLQLWLCLYFWLKLHWKPVSSAISLVLRCAYFIAKSWSCVVQRAREHLLYRQTLLCPFSSCILPWCLHFPQVLPEIVVFNGEVKPIQLHVFKGHIVCLSGPLYI